MFNQLFFFSAKLTDWNQIFYGTETVPGETFEAEVVAEPKGTVRPSEAFEQVKVSGAKWKEVAQLTSDELLSDMSGETLSGASGCRISTKSCLGLCLALVVFIFSLRNSRHSSAYLTT